MKRMLMCVVVGSSLGLWSACADGGGEDMLGSGVRGGGGAMHSDGAAAASTGGGAMGGGADGAGATGDGATGDGGRMGGGGGGATGGAMSTGGTAASAGDGGAHMPASCEEGLAGGPGRQTVSITHDGLSRNYILHVPSSYDAATPTPLVLVFHPLLANASAAASGSGFAELAEREGFVVAFPDSAQSAAWNVGGICCTSSPDIDDVGFARAIVDDIRSAHCIDRKRIYASGFSMGGGMAHHLGCEAADLFAAIAPGAFDLFEESDCNPARPLTVATFRGTSDTIVPYAGGTKTSAPNGFRGEHTFEGAEDTLARWARINGCTDGPADLGAGCLRHTQCEAGVEVTLCTSSAGHAWPDAEQAWQMMRGFSLP